MFRLRSHIHDRAQAAIRHQYAFFFYFFKTHIGAGVG